MIEVKKLYHKYPGQVNFAVNDVSFRIEKGEIFGFLGPSGAGKSTVQNIMTGLLQIQQGDVVYEGKSIRNVTPDFFNYIGVSFEQSNLYEKLTGEENLRYYAGLFDVPTRDPMKLLEEVGLSDAAHKRAREYSKGMKQRVNFARSLINNPSILFLDEPLTGLDPATGEKLKKIIIDQKKKGVTIFLTTHNMFTADELCDRVAFINDGRIAAMDSPRNLKLQYGTNSVKVEWQSKGSGLNSEILFLGRMEDRNRMQQLMDEGNIQTIHSQEATLEQIFIKLTGRGLV
jgi:fluoroquinolone transport system ATP-binding protein